MCPFREHYRTRDISQKTSKRNFQPTYGTSKSLRQLLYLITEPFVVGHFLSVLNKSLGWATFFRNLNLGTNPKSHNWCENMYSEGNVFKGVVVVF